MNPARRLAIAAIAVLCAACGGSDDPSSAPASSEGEDVKAFMTGYFETFDGYDKDAILALYATDVSAEISGLGTMAGRDAVRDQWLVPFTSAFPDYSHTVDELTIDGTHVTAEFVFQGTHEGPLLGNEPTGKHLTLPIVGNYDVEDQVVTSFTLEYDVGIVLAAITP